MSPFLTFYLTFFSLCFFSFLLQHHLLLVLEGELEELGEREEVREEEEVDGLGEGGEGDDRPAGAGRSSRPSATRSLSWRRPARC